MNQVSGEAVTRMGETERSTENYSDQTSNDALLRLYAAIHQPDQYWAVIRDLQGLNDNLVSDEALHQHANGIEKLIDQALIATPISSENKDEYSLMFDQSGRIRSTGLSISLLWSSQKLGWIWDLPLSTDDCARLRDFLNSRSKTTLVLVLYGGSDDVSRIAKVTRGAQGSHNRFEIQRLSLAPGAEEVFAENFGVSPAQFQVLEHLVEGQSIASIAKQLNRSGETIRSHVKALFRKLAVRGQAELVVRSLSVPVTESHGTMSKEGYREVWEKSTSRRVQYVTFGDPVGQPILYFHQATDGPNITQRFDAELMRAGLRLVGIARPGVGRTVGPAHRCRDYLRETAAAYELVAKDVLGGAETMFAVGTGLPHALAYAQRYAPKALIVAANPFPAFVTRQICNSMPGRWRSFALIAHRSPTLVQAITLLAYKFFRLRPDEQAERILRDEIRQPINSELRTDILNTINANLALNAINRASHFVEEAKVIRDDWVADAATNCRQVTLKLIQGSGHFALPQQQFESLQRDLQNAEILEYDRPSDPLHLLDPAKVCELLGPRA